jgi:hypothetical protein
VDRVSPSQQGEYRGSVPAEGPSYQPSPRIRLLSCSLRCNSERGIVRKGASCVSPCFATSGALFRVAMPGGAHVNGAHQAVAPIHERAAGQSLSPEDEDMSENPQRHEGRQEKVKQLDLPTGCLSRHALR